MPRVGEKSKPPEDGDGSEPTVRLAVPLWGATNSLAKKCDKAFAKDEPEGDEEAPNVRLVVGGFNKNSQGAGKGRVHGKALGEGYGTPPTVRLAHVTGAQGDNNLLGRNGVEQLPRSHWPALLISYVYLEPFLQKRDRYAYRDWVLDSGAFSAHNSGTEITVEEYTEKAKELLASDPRLSEVFGLDVIGDYRASLKNVEYMWKRGVPAIPTFHYGSPWPELKSLARDYPKLAVGGCVGKRDKDGFASQVFARVWPKRLHGFGFGSEKSVMMLPWHSVDATNWETGPCAFGRWNGFNAVNKNMSVRGSAQNLRVEVEYYLELERKARERWRKEMTKLPPLDSEPVPPTVRLAADANSGGGKRLESALDNPTVRLVGSRGGGGQGRLDSGLESKGKK